MEFWGTPVRLGWLSAEPARAASNSYIVAACCRIRQLLIEDAYGESPPPPLRRAMQGSVLDASPSSCSGAWVHCSACLAARWRLIFVCCSLQRVGLPPPFLCVF
ncbi:unnamed protein product [Prorocentrum cordatum]|uniref:Uncharacterized protein n=1 Tax=Prorocentrum cordatum TaxID=2364126 RepID=A0ABN9QJ89_9DINO|nr:unnamed protein product [Polarella glacialis]